VIEKRADDSRIGGELDFSFRDTKIPLGSHAHGDRMAGDAMVKVSRFSVKWRVGVLR
jgi:hypothetical protein